MSSIMPEFWESTTIHYTFPPAKKCSKTTKTLKLGSWTFMTSKKKNLKPCLISSSLDRRSWSFPIKPKPSKSLKVLLSLYRKIEQRWKNLFLVDLVRRKNFYKQNFGNCEAFFEIFVHRRFRKSDIQGWIWGLPYWSWAQDKL